MVHHECVLPQHPQFLAGSVQGWPRQVFRQDLVVQLPRDPAIFPVPVHQPAVRRSPPAPEHSQYLHASTSRSRHSLAPERARVRPPSGIPRRQPQRPALKNVACLALTRRRIKPDHPDTKAARSTATSSTVVLPEPCPCAKGKPCRCNSTGLAKIPGNHLLSPRRTTIGRDGLSFCVRNGNRRFPARKVTRKFVYQAAA